MTTDSKTLVEEGTPRYLASGNPDLHDYYPAWLDNLADDATVEGSMLNGAVRGAEAVRTIVATIRTVYRDSQEFHFTGPCGDNGWLEDYVARIDDEPLGCVVLVTRNAAGQTQHVVASYRPLSTVLYFSRLLHEKLVGTPYAETSSTGSRETDRRSRASPVSPKRGELPTGRETRATSIQPAYCRRARAFAA